MGHVACMGRAEVRDGFWWENLRERDHVVGVGIDGRIILTWILNTEWEGVEWIRVAQGWIL